ncbi:MAG: hypothetical protein WC551_01330 [Patescibacteria group bacterium]
MSAENPFNKEDVGYKNVPKSIDFEPEDLMDPEVQKALRDSITRRQERQKLEHQKREQEKMVTPEEIVLSEKKAWQKFFGKPVEVPAMPEWVTPEAIKKFEGRMDFHYIPEAKLWCRKNNVLYLREDVPGWEVPEEFRGWIPEVTLDPKNISGNRVLSGFSIIRPNERTFELTPGWYMVGAKEDDHGEQLLDMDGSISNYGVRRDVLNLIESGKVEPKIPKFIELNVLGQLYYPNMGANSDLQEVVSEKYVYESEEDYCVIRPVDPDDSRKDLRCWVVGMPYRKTMRVRPFLKLQAEIRSEP